jgi:hypothetical protein
MTEQQQSEWQQIRAQQDVLRQEWARLEARVASFETSLGPPPPVRPAEPVSGQEVPAAVSAVPPPMRIPRTADPPRPAPAPAQSLEMRIGTTWLVRAGIVLLLTSLAFLGNYLYQNVVPHLGPGGKVALLYLGAGMLTGFGAWLERSRQARELTGLRDYARVVLAGGLAAIYYVTYAAHYYPQLRVIQSALVAGLLLVGWAAFLVWLADQRESEILATFAVLLAYYTSAINEIAGFTLVSNLVLTTGAVYLMRRHLWRVFPFASLLATFGSYGFWHLCYTHPVWRVLSGPYDAHPRGGGCWLEGGFLLVYWALFNWAVFTTGERLLPVARRATFISLNNGAFFALTTWILLGDYPDAFWKWSLVFGAALVAVGELGRRMRLPLDGAAQQAYETQGSLLITLGCIDYFSGWQLSLALAVQSRVLLAVAGRRRSGLFLAFAWGTAFAAFICAAHGLEWAAWNFVSDGVGGWVTALTVGAFFVEEAWRCERWRLAAGGDAEPVTEGWRAAVQTVSAAFALLGAGLWFGVLETKVTFAPALAPGLAVAAVAMLLLNLALRVPALNFFACAYLIAGQSHWLCAYSGLPGLADTVPPWWNLVGLLGATLLFGQLDRPAAEGPRPDATRPAFWPVFREVAMALGTLCGWCYVSQHLALLHGSAFNIAARWSVYAAAVFAVGLALRERVYRWLGLLILVATLGRVAFFDIWQIDLLERALGLLTLGIVLLGMGFFYTRFGAKVRDLL